MTPSYATARFFPKKAIEMQYSWVIWVVIFLLFLCLLLGVFYSHRRSSLKKEALIHVATEYARQQGWQVENYVISSVARRREGCWIEFQGKSGLVGDHFSVLVDVSSGRAIQLIPGK